MELANGKIGSRNTFAKLDARDCYQIGIHRIDQKYPLTPTTRLPEYALAIEWIETALKYIILSNI